MLWDEMGLGKSAQAIRAADLVNAQRILVIAPAIARVNWSREFDKFSVFKRTFDLVFEKSFCPSKNPANSVIISYDLASQFDPKSFGQFDLLILDEAHYLKNLETKRTIKVLGKEGYVRHAKKIWTLTGTPAPNHAGELYPILFTFGCTPLSYSQFIEKYCDTIPCTYSSDPTKRTIVGTKTSGIGSLRAQFSGKMLRRSAEEVMKELPEIFYSHVVVEAGDVDFDCEFPEYTILKDRTHELHELLNKQLKLVDDITEIARLGKDGMKVLEGLAKSVSTLRRYTGLQKLQAVVEMVEEELMMGNYEKVVIFAIHRGVIKTLRDRLTKFKPVTLYGGTPPEKRQAHIDKFQKNPKCRVFIGNIQASGTAITLTAANQVIFIEQDWVPGNNAQAAKRCHRIGQEKPVFVRFISLKDSYDERISQILKRKTAELSEIFEKNT